MKNIFIIITLLICKLVNSQNFTTVDAFDYPSNIMYGENGYYFQDTQNYFGQYVGIWRYNGGNLLIELRFIKKTFTRQTVNNLFKVDAIVGGIRVVKNGAQVMNTINTIYTNQNSNTKYHIFNGPRVLNGDDCLGCTVPDQRLYMHYREPDNTNKSFNFMGFEMHVRMVGNSPRLYLNFSQVNQIGDPYEYDPEYDDVPTNFELHLPYGIYEFVKIN